MRYLHRKVNAAPIGAVLMCAAVLVAVLVGCGGGNSSSVSVSSPPFEIVSASSAPPVAESDSLEAPQSESSLIPPRPDVLEYTVEELDEERYENADGSRYMQLDVLPKSQAAQVVANAWLCEITGAFWKWEFLCETPLREPALAMHYVDALEQGYNEGYGYEAILVESISELSAEQLYTTMNRNGDLQLLWPYYISSGTQAAYEEYVNVFLAEGNRVVYMRGTLVNTALQASVQQEDNTSLNTYFVLAPDAAGNLVIKNSTQYTSGAFYVG